MENNTGKVGQDQIQELLFGEKLSWQAIIYELINTEQLNVWDIDISLLANKYLEKVRELEEANFFVSSKVLFAASLLLRMKSDLLLNNDLPNLDNVLFGKTEEKKYVQERIELDEDFPELIPRTPLSRMRKVTLQELMVSLGKAINTENRRIKKEIVLRQHQREADIVMPKNTINLKVKIRDIYRHLKEIFSDREERVGFSHLLDKSKEDKVAAFVSLLHLDNQQKVWLEQEEHFDEIWILLKHLYEKQNKESLDKLRAEVEALENKYDEELDEFSKSDLEENRDLDGEDDLEDED